MLAAAKAKFRC